MSEIEKELKEMEELITANTDAPMTSVPNTNAPSTEAPGTEAPGTEAPSTEVSVTEAPATSVPTTEAPSEFDTLRDEIKSLREELKKKDSPNTKSPSTSAPSTSAPTADEDFLGELDLDDLTRNSETFNKLLNAVYKKGIEASKAEVRSGHETVLRSIPDIVKTNILTVSNLRKASEQFYEDNKDLKSFKKVVGTVFEEEVAKNPDKTYDEVLKEVGPEVRKRLDLQKKANEPNKDKKPRLPKKGSQQRQSQQKPNTGSLESELSEMNESLNT